MKKITLILVIIFMMAIGSSVYGAANISVSSTSTTVGNTITVTVNFTGVGSWDATITPSGPVKEGVKKIVGDTGTGYNGTGTGSVTYTTTGAGTATFTLSGNTTTEDLQKAVISGSKSVTITAPTVVAPPPATTTPTTTTSNNANLKRLLPNYEGLSPNFNPDVTKYSLTVPSHVTSVNFAVAVEATGAKYWISGDDNLKMGDNTVTVTVTATDGTKKVYTIVVTKAEDIAKANAYLSSIVIDGKTLSPEFTSENLEYDVGTVTSDVEKLTILAYAQSENSDVKIIGNESLTEGENTIKVIVTAVDGITTKEYIIKVNKELSKVVGIVEENKNVNIYEETDSLQDIEPSKFQNFVNGLSLYIQQFGLVICLFLFSLFELFQIIYLYNKLNKVDNIHVVKNNDNIEDSVIQPRRKNIETIINNTFSEIDNENSIDDTSDELLDSSKDNTVEEDITDNFEDSKDIE